MEINKKDLKKTSRKFRQLASRVLNAHFNEVNSLIKMFIEYVDNTPVISEYIQSIFVEYPNLREEIKRVSDSYGRLFLPTGATPEQEISYIYQILKFISKNPSFQTYSLGWVYTSSKKYQDMVKEFGNRIVMPFVEEINVYLSDIATDMGYDEESKFIIKVDGGQAQVNISNGNSTLNATQNIQKSQPEIDILISKLKSSLETELADNVTIKNILLAQIKLIESEKVEKKPRKEVLKTSINTIQNLLKTIPVAVTAIENGNKLNNLISKLFN